MTLYTARDISLQTGLPQKQLTAWPVSQMLRGYRVGGLVRFELKPGALAALTAYAKGLRHGKYLLRKHRKLMGYVRGGCDHQETINLDKGEVGCISCESVTRGGE